MEEWNMAVEAVPGECAAYEAEATVPGESSENQVEAGDAMLPVDELGQPDRNSPPVSPESAVVESAPVSDGQGTSEQSNIPQSGNSPGAFLVAAARNPQNVSAAQTPPLSPEPEVDATPGEADWTEKDQNSEPSDQVVETPVSENSMPGGETVEPDFASAPSAAHHDEAAYGQSDQNPAAFQAPEEVRSVTGHETPVQTGNEELQANSGMVPSEMMAESTQPAPGATIAPAQPVTPVEVPQAQPQPVATPAVPAQPVQYADYQSQLAPQEQPVSAPVPVPRPQHDVAQPAASPLPAGAVPAPGIPMHQVPGIHQPPPQPAPQPVALDPQTGMPIQQVYQTQQMQPQPGHPAPSPYVDPGMQSHHPAAPSPQAAIDPYTGQPIQQTAPAAKSAMPASVPGHPPAAPYPAGYAPSPAAQQPVPQAVPQQVMPHPNPGVVAGAPVPAAPAGVAPQADAAESNGERAQRRRIFKGIKIGFGNDYCAVDGVMRNISETGAFIEVKDGFLVPDEISIQNELEGYKVRCEVVRREANRIGVRFIGEKQKIQSTKHQVVNMIESDDGGAQAAEDQQQDIIRPRSGPPKKPVFGQRRL